MKYLLLGTSGCHLCEMAEELIHECLVGEESATVELIDIAEQTQWQEDYATLIPVLLHIPTNKSLNWPFTKEQVLTFIKQYHDQTISN
ncbi:MAG: glutaredoxin family protein [Methyloglobulus sp.]